MDWVAEGIAIGGRRDALDHASLKAAGIEAVLQLYGPERESLEFPFASAVCCLFVIDGEPLPLAVLREGVRFIRAQREQGGRCS
jgi:hypothetical protein